MLKGLMNYGAYRAAGLGLTLAVSAGYEAYDRFVHFAPVEARITKVVDRCVMEKRSGGQMVKSNEYDCRTAEAAVKNNALWQGAHIAYDVNVDFEYVSPADGQLHGDSRSLTSWPQGRRVSRGDKLQIRASRSDPEITKGI